MKLFSRIKNIWELSAYVPAENTGDLVVDEEPTAILVKEKVHLKDVFIPRVKVDPIKAITEEQHAN